MKRNVLFGMLLALLAVTSTGCHHLSKDYGKYLTKDPIPPLSSKKDLETGYYLTKNTREHVYKFRVFASGIGNVWIVEFGQMLDAALQSQSVQTAFGKLKKQVDDNSSNGNVLIFDLQKYEFSDFNAHISLKVTLVNNSKTLFDKVYYADGRAQAGKMIWGGAMSTRNAVQQSTKYALTKILSELLTDLQSI